VSEMLANQAQELVDYPQLKHNFSNDLNCLWLSIEALKLMHEEPEEFECLMQQMHESLTSLQVRLTQLLDSLPSTASEEAN
jgi:hypothetical protein